MTLSRDTCRRTHLSLAASGSLPIAAPQVRWSVSCVIAHQSGRSACPLVCLGSEGFDLSPDCGLYLRSAPCTGNVLLKTGDASNQKQKAHLVTVSGLGPRAESCPAPQRALAQMAYSLPARQTCITTVLPPSFLLQGSRRTLVRFTPTGRAA